MPKGRFGLDDVKEIASLKGLGNSEARIAIPALKEMFFKSQAEMFKPYKELTK